MQFPLSVKSSLMPSLSFSSSLQALDYLSINTNSVARRKSLTKRTKKRERERERERERDEENCVTDLQDRWPSHNQ